MSPFNCFSSPGHDETLPRHSLPPLQPSPPRSPSRPGGVRRSFDGNGRERQALKGRIGKPTGFKHVGHVGGDGAFGEEGGQLASSLAAITSALSTHHHPLRTSSSVPSSPVSPSSHQLEMARSASAGPLPSPSSSAAKHASLPPPVPVPFGDVSNRSSPSLSAPSPSSPPRQRPVSAQPPKRKAPPQVTASVIRAVPGGAEEVEKSGPVPTLAKRGVAGGGGVLASLEEGGKLDGGEKAGGAGGGSGVLALQELFTPSEIHAIQRYQEGSEGSEGGETVVPSAPMGGGEKAGEGEGEKVQEPGTQTRIFNQAMGDVEKALRGAA
ncbi:hypothetical protein JCM8547_008157 [Rhodosporidiobolus lusitaniae]